MSTNSQNPFQQARQQGYSDEEIMQYLEKSPKYSSKISQAREQGYSNEDIQKYLSFRGQEASQKPSRGVIEKGARLATQGLIGGIQTGTLAYDIPAIFGKIYGEANAPLEFRQNIFNDLEDLADQKARGQWSEEDQKRWDSNLDLINNPEKMDKFLPKNIPDFDVASLIEKGAKQFGVDLTPEDTAESAMRWIGFIKNPAKAQELMKNGLNPKNAKEVVRALIPNPKEIARGVGAATAMEYAAAAELGPIGTMIAAVVGDMAPSLALRGGKSAFEFAKNPVKNTKKGLAKGVAAFTPRDKEALQKALITDFREAGVQADLGTVSGNNIIKWIQSTIQQSGLSGNALEEFKKSISNNVVSEYHKLASKLGESVYESRYEAGEALKTGLKEARDIDLGIARKLYNSATERAGTNQVFTGNIGKAILELEQKLEPGSLKSTEQQKVIDVLQKVKNDVLTPEGGIKGAEIKSLINDKIALNDIIDYEVQGGAKKLLMQLVGEIDDAIKSHGSKDPKFAKEWTQANKKFGEHAKLFRGKTISQALKTQDPSLLFSKMNTPHGIAEIKKALTKTPEGIKLFDQLARFKLEELIGKNMVDGTTNQLKFGTFSKLLEKGQNREVVKQLIGPESLSKLQKLQNSSGKLAETAQKFLNTSRSGVHAADLTYAAKLLNDMGSVLSGNPWPLLGSAGGLLGAKRIAKLMADPGFIRLVEDVLLESEKGSESSLQRVGSSLANKIRSLEESSLASVENRPKKNLVQNTTAQK